MAKRVKYLSESDIAKMMNESDSDTDDSDFSYVSSSESEYSDDTEIVDYADIGAENLCTSDWKTNIRELPSIEFISNSGIHINSSEPVEEELDFINLFFTNEIIEVIANETNKFAKLIFDKSVEQPGSSKSLEVKCI